MPSLGITTIYFLLPIVTTSFHASLNFGFDSFVLYSSDSENGREENIPTELHRQKREVAESGFSPVQYIADLEISSPDSSLLESIKDYLKTLSFPVPVNTVDGTMSISSINVTTLCKTTSNNETHCSCESGYKWPAALCSVNSTCPNTMVTPEKTCDCITQLPSQGPYCLPQDIPPKTIKIKMSLTLKVTFQDALKNSSSELYKQYKSDLESAFTQSYKSLPGFVSATVTGFRPGSVIVDYEVNTSSPTLTQIKTASTDVIQSINATYQPEPNSFTYEMEITDEINISVSPGNIFQGDTVTVNCETLVSAEVMTWYHSGQEIRNSSRHSMYSITIAGTTKSRLRISDVTLDDAGPYKCTFTNSSSDYTLVYTATENVTVSPMNIVQSANIEVICNSSKVRLSCCVDATIQTFSVSWTLNGAINISGNSSSTTDCTLYTLQAKPSQCPSTMSATKITYTCELSTGNGALGSKTIDVTYLAEVFVTMQPSTKTLVSEGHRFSLICSSDVSSYFTVTWQIQSGTSLKTIDQERYIKNTQVPTARSNLTVDAASQEWNGTYTCTFYQNSMQSSASVVIEIVPLPLKQNIWLDPIEAYVPCNGSQTLKCCIYKTEDYTVIFIVQGKEFQTVKNIQGNQVCYEYNYTDSYTSKTVTGYCKITNHINHSVTSSPMTLHITSVFVTIQPSTKTQVSEGHRFSLICSSDVSSYFTVTWQIQSGTSLKTIDQERYIENKQVPTARSNLTVDAASQEWNGTYTCTFYQNSMQSSASVVIEIVPLPLKQNIWLDPIEAYVPCNRSQTLKCCTYKTEDYTVTFIVQGKEFQTVKNIQGNQVCYEYNYTDSCPSKNVTGYCKITNHINHSVTSSPMTLHITSDTIPCNDNIGVGTNGAQITRPCQGSANGTNPIRGNLTYVCENKTWKLLRNNCLSEQINTLLSAAELLVSGPRPKEEVGSFLVTLQNNTMKEQQVISSSPANLGAVVTILDKISVIPMNADQDIMNYFLSTVDIIVSNSTRDVWIQLNNQTGTQRNTSSLLLDSVERFSQFLRPVNSSIPSINTTNLQLQGIVITENSTSGYNKSFAFSSSVNLSGNVLIKKDQIQRLERNSTIISVAFSTLKDILPQPAETNESVNSLVMTTTVSSNLTKDFRISLTFAKSNFSLKNPQCVFWNFSLSNGSGGWDDTGCNTTDDGDNVVCNCSHLTSFSILMSPYSDHLPDALDYITYIGLSISILSLVVCILIESLVWKSVTKNRTSYMRHVCMLNIAVSLLIADIWFIVAASIRVTKEPVNGDVCIAATFFIHLFYLCVFFWMLVMGLMIFYRLVFILHVTSKTIQKTVAFSLGYGCPLLISVITIAVTQPRDVYRRENACWLNWEKSKALLAFVIPALIIVAVNLIIVVVVIVKILRPAIGDKPSNQEKSYLIQIIKSVSILTPLLGLTWGFGLATIIEGSSVVFHILFTLLNAFQGLFILVFGTLWDKKVQEALLNKYSSTKWSSQQTKSTSLGVSAPMFSMGSPFSRALNNLFGKAGKYKVSSRETTCSSTEQTSSIYSLLH